VNLDRLLERPTEFTLLVALPVAVGGLGLAMALLSRTLWINLLVFVALQAALELAAHWFSPAPPAIAGEPVVPRGGDFYVRDAALGYRLAPSTVARHQRTENGRVAYDVTYRTDAFGRRLTPVRGDPARGAFLLFFGDSNTFGEGLEQDQTLPFYAGELAGAHRPYNYAAPGWGPGQMLELAKSGRIPREVDEPHGSAVYFFIPAHLGRVVGSSEVASGWGRNFPHYRLDGTGGLVRRGDFAGGRPLTTLAYFFWSRSSLVSALGARLPPSYRDEDYRLTAKILGEARDLLGRQVSLDGFAVALGQALNEPQRRVTLRMRAALAGEGVASLDYTDLYDASDLRYSLSALDKHNSALANWTLAGELVRDLGLAVRVAERHGDPRAP
jgi:hypothetical protein